MIKQVCTILLLSFLAHACTSPETKKIEPLPRDVSITKEISYSDLYLDSLLVEQFIIEQLEMDSLLSDESEIKLQSSQVNGLEDSALAVRQLKERLRIAGDFLSEDTSLFYTGELVEAVTCTQKRFGLEMDGIAGPATLRVIRQKPGNSNALGKVKFIFPNNYNIYFHDTPAQSLFDRARRAFSHGCIRLDQPKKLAAYLLQHSTKWTEEAIKAAMNSGKEQWVTLEEPVSVLITYFTAWVDEEGLLNFREDIYGHDQELADRLFAE